MTPNTPHAVYLHYGGHFCGLDFCALWGNECGSLTITGFRHCPLFYPAHNWSILASLVLEGSVRLVSSNDQPSNVIPSSGRLEVYINGHWGTVCTHNFSITAAHIVCRQLGFVRAMIWGGLGWVKWSQSVQSTLRCILTDVQYTNLQSNWQIQCVCGSQGV